MKQQRSHVVVETAESNIDKISLFTIVSSLFLVQWYNISRNMLRNISENNSKSKFKTNNVKIAATKNNKKRTSYNSND